MKGVDHPGSGLVTVLSSVLLYRDCPKGNDDGVL